MHNQNHIKFVSFLCSGVKYCRVEKSVIRLCATLYLVSQEAKRMRQLYCRLWTVWIGFFV